MGDVIGTDRLEVSSHPAPQPAAQALLLACLARATGLARTGVSARPCNAQLWPEVERAARDHGVLAWLEGGLEGISAPDALVAASQAERRAAAQRNLFLAAELLRIDGAFAEAGVAYRAFKGPVAALQIHGDLSRRPSGDLDLLVSKRRWDEAASVLEACGYVRAECHRLHLQATFWHPDRRLPVDLHWGVAPARYRPRKGAPWRASTVDVLGRAITTFDGPDTLAITAIGAVKDFRGFSLHPFLDVAVLLQRLDPRAWLAARNRARAIGCERHLLAAGYVCARLFGQAAFPETVVRSCNALGAAAGAMALRRLQLSPAAPPPDPSQDNAYYRHLYRPAVRLQHALARTVLPNAADFAWIALPARLRLLYFALRPMRLGARGARRLLQLPAVARERARRRARLGAR